LVKNSLPNKIIKINIPAGSATIAPPLGPLLGQYGIGIPEFCKEFNEESSKIFVKETIIPVRIYIGSNKVFYFKFCNLSISYLLGKYIDSLNNKNYIKKNNFLKIIYNIAYFKLNIFYENENISEVFFKKYINCLIGTFRSFKIKIIK